VGALPDRPHAPRTSQQAATRIETYRFDHAGGPENDRRPLLGGAQAIAFIAE
jgi:hypothetical protein